MNTILVPLDLSENSINALQYANRFASVQQANLVILNIYTGDVSNYESGWPIQEDIDTVKPERQDIISSIVKKHCTVPTSIEIVEGDVVDSIVEYANKNSISLIIMGTHGATGIKAVLMGSNTSNVVAQSAVPVLAIPIGLSFTTINKIIYASDFLDFEHEIAQIINFVKPIGASIEVLHLSYDNHDYVKNEDVFNSIIKQHSDIDVVLKQKQVGMEEPLTEQLKAYLATQNNALLAMFTQERDWFGKLFLSSKTEELANDLELPLLAFHSY